MVVVCVAIIGNLIQDAFVPVDVDSRDARVLARVRQELRRELSLLNNTALATIVSG